MMRTKTAFLRAVALVGALAAVVLPAAEQPPQPQEAAAPPDLSQTTTGAIESRAEVLVRNQDFVPALPYLEELVRRLGSTESAAIQSKLGSLRYYLGIARMVNRQFAEAAEMFKEFIEKHPQHDFAAEALGFRADCLRSSQNYQPAAEAYAQVLKNPNIRGQERVLVQARVADCYVQLKDWPNATPALEAVLLGTTDPELRGDAAKSLTQAYVETGDATKIFRLLSILSAKGSSARTDVGFNMNLLASADKMLADGKFGIALYMYQLVLPTEELVKRCKEKREELLALRERMIKERAPFKKIMTVTERMDTIETQEKMIAEAQPYTVELRLRIAKTYFDMGRKWEALWAFVRVWEEFPDNPLAEQALSAAFSLAGELVLLDRAIGFGETYLAKFAEGASKDQVGLELGKVYTAAGQAQKAIDHYKKLIEANPKSTYADQMLFLAGYNYFMTEQFPKAIECFERVVADFPESASAADSEYWRAMAFLFDEKYAEASKAFTEFAEKRKDNHYAEDARFRVAACAYGQLKFDESQAILSKFVADFPDSPLRGEALVLMGDIAGAQGRLGDAINYFKQVHRHTTNMQQVDYAAFQVGKIQEMEGSFADMERWFQQYLDTYGLKGQYTEAIWRIGFARKNQNNPQGMLDIYFDALKKYGNDPSAVGIDLILNGWPNDYEAVNGKLPEKEMREELSAARVLKQRTRELRWMMALQKHNLLKEGVSFTLEDVPIASPAVLVWAGEIFREKNPALAERAYQRVTEAYGGTEWVEPALLELGDIRVKQGRVDEALPMFERLVKLVATSRTAGVAMKRAADIYMEKGNYDEAIKRYSQVLEVKEWRGEVWPESLFKIGECLMAQGKVREAFAYYQRVYVLYQHYSKWAALAYLRSADALEKLGVKNDAVATLKEMLAQEDLKGTPEYQQAKAKLEKMQ
ncbi:MAG TPA: tetratricopeptide repeat protein [Verrucomicrobiae bacterium]|nr:tetratricopeptide repeat protein [Verrucomicrobiae bacterium]